MSDEFKLAFEEVVRSSSGVSYQNLQLLGTGGNAATHLMVATAGPHRGVPFAVKFFRRLSRPEWRASFDREADFLKECSHPAIMRYFDRGRARDQYPFFVAEYLPRTLAAVIREGRSSVVEKLCHATQLLSAIAYLAGRGEPVVHRDIKPENIFVKGQSCVLGDFGLIKIIESTDDDRQLLKESLGPGMPRRYRTPDQVAYLRGGGPPTPKSDVYQFGLVFAELFTGRNPQQPASGDDFRSDIVLDRLAPIPGASFAKRIRLLIQSMLEGNPDTRPAAAGLLVTCERILFDAAKRLNALEGRVL